MNDYQQFLANKTQSANAYGFEPMWLPEFLFDFQQACVTWAIEKGRAALFEDCGLGKSIQQLVWAENIVRKTGGKVLILTPLAVSIQTVKEADKFGIEVQRSQDGTAYRGITVTNYERLDAFNVRDFVGVVCDESSILKSFDGVRRAAITEFMRTVPYRLLCTATAAPNDYIELGTSSEALGELGYMDMLTRFFKNQSGNASTRRMRYEEKRWRLKGHAERPFWRWVCSWARALRQPSDLGCDDGPFVLPPLQERQHLIRARTLPDGFLFEMPAIGLQQQREERRRTIQERCEQVAELVAHDQPALVWCHLNPEGDLLERLIPDAVQVHGRQSDEDKTQRFQAFIEGQARVLICKPRIGAWGLNLQHCAHVVYFPDHSFESYYQAIRRCWRFGQTRPVVVDLVMTEGDQAVMENMRRKAQQADLMFSQLVAAMHHSLSIARDIEMPHQEELPPWLSSTKTSATATPSITAIAANS